jgi:hypothetical protein
VRVVEAVHRLRVLSSAQIAALYFPAVGDVVSSACRTRLRHLTNAGYLERGEQPVARTEGRLPYVYFLTAQGRSLLSAELGYEPDQLDWKPSYNNVRWPFLAHQLALNDAYVNFSLAAERGGWSLSSWIDDRILRKRHTERYAIRGAGVEQQVAVVPDAYFVLGRDQTYLRFFLELDRATMSVAARSGLTKSWQRRILGYQAFFASPRPNEMYGSDKIRVLTLTTGQQRLWSLKQATEEAGGRNRYWFAEAERVTPATALYEPIWHIASRADGSALLARP